VPTAASIRLAQGGLLARVHPLRVVLAGHAAGIVVVMSVQPFPLWAAVPV